MVVLRVQAFEQLAKSQIVTGPDVALAMHCHLKRGHFQFAIGLLQQHEDKWLHMEHSQQQMLFDDVLAANTRGCDALEVAKWLLGLGMQQGAPNTTTQAACLITKCLGDQQFRDATEVSTSMTIIN